MRTLTPKRVNCEISVKEKIGALGLTDVDSYGNADSTQDEDSAFLNCEKVKNG